MELTGLVVLTFLVLLFGLGAPVRRRNDSERWQHVRDLVAIAVIAEMAGWR